MTNEDREWSTGYATAAVIAGGFVAVAARLLRPVMASLRFVLATALFLLLAAGAVALAANVAPGLSPMLRQVVPYVAAALVFFLWFPCAMMLIARESAASTGARVVALLILAAIGIGLPSWAPDQAAGGGVSALALCGLAWVLLGWLVGAVAEVGGNLLRQLLSATGSVYCLVLLLPTLWLAFVTLSEVNGGIATGHAIEPFGKVRGVLEAAICRDDSHFRMLASGVCRKPDAP